MNVWIRVARYSGTGALAAHTLGHMRLRIASYNVENLFSRPRAMNQESEIADVVLALHARINDLLDNDAYTDADKEEILTILGRLRLVPVDRLPEKVADRITAAEQADGVTLPDESFAILRDIRGKLLHTPRDRAKDITVVAAGKDDFLGWVDLVRDRIEARVIANIARVFDEVNADIVGVVEAEDRFTLKRFSETLLPDRYPHVMVIDGNDTRGIDVGVLSTPQYPLQTIRSHVDDGPIGKPIFSRDCPEYAFLFPEGSELAGQSFVVLVNHLKSKFGGNSPESVAKRRAQAEQVAAIYRRLRDEGVEHVVVLGDLNDVPGSAPLAPLLADTDLKDISLIPADKFDDGDPDEDRPGTIGNGTKSQKIDYILLSPALFERVSAAGIFRKGVWGGKNGDLFPHFDTIEKEHEAASDHAALYVDLEI